MDMRDRVSYRKERKKVEILHIINSISLRLQNARLFSYMPISDKGFGLSWVSSPTAI